MAIQVEQYKFSGSAELKGGSAPADGRAEPSGDRAGRRSRGSVPALPGSILGHIYQGGDRVLPQPVTTGSYIHLTFRNCPCPEQVSAILVAMPSADTGEGDALGIRAARAKQAPLAQAVGARTAAAGQRPR
jgi:hypothetical protein